MDPLLLRLETLPDGRSFATYRLADGRVVEVSVPNRIADEVTAELVSEAMLAVLPPAPSQIEEPAG